MNVQTMPEQRPGQEIITIYLPTETKKIYKHLCALRGTNMSADILDYINNLIEEEAEVVAFMRDRISKKSKSRPETRQG